MLLNIKALIVILTIAAVVFAAARPLCLKFMAERDFRHRRDVWFVLTVAAFLSPSFWLYALVALPVAFWGAQKDSNPVAFYLVMLHVIPPIGLEIPVVGINRLFELNNYRILSFAVLVPVAWRLLQSKDRNGYPRLVWMDKLIFAYFALQLVELMPYESITNTMRRAFLFGIDVFALYYVVSRHCTKSGATVEAMASFCLICAVSVPLAVFETLRHWILYEGLADQWGIFVIDPYLQRAGTLRAQVWAGHSISLGYMLAMAFGFLLYLRTRIPSAASGVFIALWMWVGMIAAYARAPWLVAAAIFFVLLLLGPNGPARFLKASLISALIAGVVLVSPVGERVIDSLPFIGKIDASTVAYRQRLAEVSWQLILQNPLFGSPNYIVYMEELRQGQGIIDLMNSYAWAALTYGLVGLVLFIGFLLYGVWKVLKVVKSLPIRDCAGALLGANLVACMVGTLLMMATGSFGTSLVAMFYITGGFAAAYLQKGACEKQELC